MIPYSLSFPFNLFEIPLHKVRDTTEVWYVSAIAFKLAASWEQSAIALAARIITELHQSTEASIEEVAHPRLNQIELEGLEGVWTESRVWLEPPGWIHWRLTGRGVATWLQLLINYSPLSQPALPWGKQIELENDNQLSSILTSHDVFTIQYTYARCCSLLKMAEREGLFSQETRQEITPQFNQDKIDPVTIPWLTTNGSLRATHPCEQDLIAQFALSMDALFLLSLRQSTQSGSTSPTHLLPNDRTVAKQAFTLSQAFQRFYAGCQIWGDVQLDNLPLAQVRLGLVAITRRILQIFLETVLQVESPAEL